MASVTVASTVELELPEELPAECLGVQTFVIGYHHALGRQAFRRYIVERLEIIIREVKDGLYDPREEQHDG